MRRITSNITKKINKEDIIIVIKHMQARKDVRSVVIQNTLRDIDVQQASINARIAINLVISVVCATRRLDVKTKGPRSPKAYQLKIGSVCAQDSICNQLEDFSLSDELFCLQKKIKSNQVETAAPHHLITNLAYKLKPNLKKTQYIRARIDYMC